MGAEQSTINNQTINNENKKLDNENKILNDELELLNKQVDVLSDNTKTEYEKELLLNDINSKKDVIKEKKTSLNISEKTSCEGCCDNLIKENNELKSNFDNFRENIIKQEEEKEEEKEEEQEDEQEQGEEENKDDLLLNDNENVEAFTNDNIDDHTFLIILVSIMFIYIFFKK